MFKDKTFTLTNLNIFHDFSYNSHQLLFLKSLILNSEIVRKYLQITKLKKKIQLINEIFCNDYCMQKLKFENTGFLCFTGKRFDCAIENKINIKMSYQMLIYDIFILYV